MAKIVIPHAKRWEIITDPPHKILHVISDLARSPTHPAFDAGKKFDLEKASAHAQADIDHGAPGPVFHYCDDVSRKRPADVTGNAVRVMQILTGEAEDEAPADDGKDPAAKALGAKGGAARAASMTPERRAEIAKAAALKRWAK